MANTDHRFFRAKRARQEARIVDRSHKPSHNIVALWHCRQTQGNQSDQITTGYGEYRQTQQGGEKVFHSSIRSTYVGLFVSG